jgi:hypothetical protein
VHGVIGGFVDDGGDAQQQNHHNQRDEHFDHRKGSAGG